MNLEEYAKTHGISSGLEAQAGCGEQTNAAQTGQAWGSCYPQPQEQVCPCCGYCPYCKRGGPYTPPQPYAPYWPPYQPYLPISTVCGGLSAASAQL